jgi:methyl-accepting chemotaxis protein
LRRGVSTVAILAQNPAAVQEWLKKNALPFSVLIDESRDVLRAYGVWHRVGLDAWNIARPALFLINRDRSVAESFVAGNQVEFPSHAEILNWISGAARNLL